MKAVIIISLLIIGCFNPIKAQSIESDSLLLKLTQNLPEGWSSSIQDSVFKVEYKDSVWVAHDNWINAHWDHLKHKDDSTWIKEYGRRTKLKFEFQMINKLDEASMKHLMKTDKTYQGQWAWRIFNSENFTLLQLDIPDMDDQMNAVWPKDTKTYSVLMLFNEYLERQ